MQVLKLLHISKIVPRAKCYNYIPCKCFPKRTGIRWNSAFFMGETKQFSVWKLPCWILHQAPYYTHHSHTHTHTKKTETIYFLFDKYIVYSKALAQVFLGLHHGYTSTAPRQYRWRQTPTVILQWRHNGRDGVSNHQPHHCLLNRLLRRRSKKTSKLRVTGLCAGNSPVTGEFPVQMSSNAENVANHIIISACLPNNTAC